MNEASINRDAASVAAGAAIDYDRTMKKGHPALRRAAIALVVVAVLLGGLRLALPSIAKARINKKLAALPEGWSGKLNRVSLSLLRGEVVARVRVEAPKIRVVLERKGKAELKEKKPIQAERLPDLEKLLPFRIDKVELDDGEIFILAGGAELKLSDAKFSVENLTNRPKDGNERFAKGLASAREQNGGSFAVEFVVDPTAAKPAFHVAFQIAEIDLPKLNPILLFELGVDVDKGRFSLASEADAKEGGFEGYVKPYVDDLEMGPTHGADKGPIKVIKEAAAAVAAAVLKNRDTKAVASKVPFKGRFDDPDVGTWEALVAVLRNAFVEAIRPSLERGR